MFDISVDWNEIRGGYENNDFNIEIKIEKIRKVLIYNQEVRLDNVTMISIDMIEEDVKSAAQGMKIEYTKDEDCVYLDLPKFHENETYETLEIHISNSDEYCRIAYEANRRWIPIDNQSDLVDFVKTCLFINPNKFSLDRNGKYNVIRYVDQRTRESLRSEFCAQSA